MLNIVLVEPEIPQNCGNIARTCAATGCVLHLIRPLGFDISEKAVRRAGLDYWSHVTVRDYENLEDFFSKNQVEQMWCLSTKAPRCYTEAEFADNCYLFFGKETKGLPEAFLEEHRDSCVRIPMLPDTRSLNLSNAVAITVYEALRLSHATFCGFHGYPRQFLEKYPYFADRIANKLGYWYFINGAVIPECVSGLPTVMRVWIENKGFCRAYYPYTVKLKLVGTGGAEYTGGAYSWPG